MAVSTKSKKNEITKKFTSFRLVRSTKFIVFFLVLFILISLSEILYVINNKPELITKYYLKRAINASIHSNPQKSIGNIINATKYEINFQSNKYGSTIPENYDLKLLLIDENKEFVKVLSDKLVELNIDFDQYWPAEIFYKLGLTAYNESEFDIAELFLQTAVYTEPDLSHYHIELANYYLTKGEKDASSEALQYCLNFPSPVKHCQDYYNSNFSANHPEKVGFLEKELGIYYNSI